MKDKCKEWFGFHRTGMKLLKLLHQTDSATIPLSILCAVVQAAYPFITLFFSAEIIDLLIVRKFQGAILFSIYFVISNFLIGLILDLLTQVCKLKAIKTATDVRVLLRKKALELDYATMEKAEVLEKVNTAEYTMKKYGGIDTLINNYKLILGEILSAIAAIVMVLILCFSKPTKIGELSVFASIPVSIILVIIFLFSILFFTRKKNRYYNKKQEKNFKEHINAERQIAYMSNQVFFDYTKGKVIRIFAIQDMLFEIYDYWMKPTRKVYEDMCGYEVNSSVLESILNGIFTTFTYLLVLVKILAGAISVGSFTKYVGVMTQFNNALMNIEKSNEDIKRLCSYLESFIEFMQLESQIETGTIPIEKRLDNEYEIEFHNVSFSYPGSSDTILNRISCKLTLKDKIAVVGCNGAGKTTFIKLLCRLYDPTEGFITLNGIDIKKYDYQAYLSLFGVVFQDFALFAFPIQENIAASKVIEEERIWSCLLQVGMKENVEKMTGQLSTPLYKYDEGGVEISGGEAQKLAIARALYKDAPFVVLDEPTAALDPISEYEIYTKFDELVKDKTSIYISHRMSSCRFCDDILVFEQGRIIERGSHNKLTQMEGTYAKLWNAQAQYYM